MNVIVPVRFAPLAERRLVNLTDTEQLAPGATVAPVQVSGPAKGPLVNMYVSRVPPLTATLVTCTDAPPAAAVFVSVTVPVPVELPVGNEMVSGEMLTVAGAVPVPVSVTAAGVTVAPV